MSRGGYRCGAGRKKGIGNVLTEELKREIDSKKLIAFIQELADGKVKGATNSERLQAATVLLRKTLPDLRASDVRIGEGEGRGIDFKIICTYPSKEDAEIAADGRSNREVLSQELVRGDPKNLS